MTHPVETIDEYASVDTALAKMASGGKRRLIVTGDDHRVVGIVSLDDVLGMLAREIRPIGRLLEQQEPRIPA
jgi:predicted transcriptional regulator